MKFRRTVHYMAYLTAYGRRHLANTIERSVYDGVAGCCYQNCINSLIIAINDCVKAAFHDTVIDTDTDIDSPDTPTSLRPARAISLRGSSRGCRCLCRGMRLLAEKVKQSVSSVCLSVCPVVSALYFEPSGFTLEFLYGS